MIHKETTNPISYLENKIHIKKLNGLNTDKENIEMSEQILDAYIWAGNVLKNLYPEEALYKKQLSLFVKKEVFGSEELPPFANSRTQMVYSHLEDFFAHFIHTYNTLKSDNTKENLLSLQSSFDVLKEFFSIYKEVIESITAGEPMGIDELYVPMAEYFLSEPDNNDFFLNMDRKMVPIENIIDKALVAYRSDNLHEQLRCMLSLAQLIDDIFFLLNYYTSE